MATARSVSRPGVLLIVDSPRGVASSWMRSRPYPGPTYGVSATRTRHGLHGHDAARPMQCHDQRVDICPARTQCRAVAQAKHRVAIGTRLQFHHLVDTHDRRPVYAKEPCGIEFECEHVQWLTQ